jgi:hypothetical protein
MKRSLFIVLALSLFVFASVGPRTAQASMADLPFLDNLIQLKPHVVSALRTVHTRVKDSNALDDFDSAYDDLVDSVNGLLESVAVDVQGNHMHLEAWTTQAGKIIDQANAFNAQIKALRSARRQPSVSARSSSITLGKGGVAVNVDLLDIVPLKKSLDDMHAAQAVADQKDRDAQAAQIRAELWPERCALGLDKLPCPGATHPH